MSRKILGYALVASAIVVGAIVVWRSTRPKEVKPRPQAAAPREAPVSTPTVATVPQPTTFPSARKWLSQHTYEDTRGRWISTYNIDGDSMYDADEIVQYGTIRYDDRTRQGAPRIMRPAVKPDDTDSDGLHDDWERGYFGELDFGKWDDPDGDGWPNVVEYNRRQSPVKIDLMDPKSRPKQLDKPREGALARRSFSTNSAEFWAAQAKAAERVKKGDTGIAPATKGFVWTPPPPKPRVEPSKPTAQEIRFAERARGALPAGLDSDADGLLDEWETHFIGNLSQTRQDDPDGDGFPNVIEWYRSTHPLKADLMDPALKPSKLEDLPAATTPWDLCWDIRSRAFWEVQAKLSAEAQTTAADAGSAGKN